MEILKQFFIYAKDHFKTDIIVIVILLILYIIVQVTMKIIDRNLSLKYKEWKSFFYKSTSRYLKVFFGMLIVWIILMTLEASKLSHHGRGLIYKLVTIIILIMVTLIILKMIGQFKRLLIVRLENADQTVTYDKSDIYTLFYFINVVIWLGVFFVILSVLKVSPASLATFGGAGAIALSFIFKNSLENIVGGVFLHLDRPFVVGESIYTIDNKIEGTVEKIGWRLTVIRQFDQRPVYVPNATFVTSAVVNISRMTNRRIKQYVGIRYCDMSKVLKVIEDIRAFLVGHEGIDQSKAVTVSLADGAENGGAFGTYQLTIAIYAFTKTTNWVEFKEIQDSIMITVAKIIHDNDADMAFPTYSLYNEEDTMAPPQIFQTNKKK